MIDVAIKRIGNRPIRFMHFHFSLKSPISFRYICYTYLRMMPNYKTN